MSKYGKNFILCGEIEHYCLLCEEIFHSIPDVEKHIRWEKHRKNFKNQVYFPKFKNDFIYKIGDKFYCEICNLVTSNFTAIKEHINSEGHKGQKNNPKTATNNFKGQYDSGAVVLSNITIGKVMWNSIADKKCLVCSVEVKNVDQHMAAEEHILNLIQSKVESMDESYFRKINEDMFHCFTCNKVFTSVDFHGHWPNCKNVDEIKKDQSELLKNAHTIFDVLGNVDAMKEIREQLIGPLQSFFWIDNKNNLATCKTCRLNVANDFGTLLQHIENHVSEEDQAEDDSDSDKSYVKESTFKESTVKESKYMTLIDNGKRRSELAKYGKLNNIKLNHNGSKGWCFLCDRYLSAHINIFKQHVEGALHRGNLELKGLISPKPHAPRKFRSKNIFKCILYYCPDINELYINEKYNINVLSFFLLRRIENDPHFEKTKCYACSELFPQVQERKHCETQTHKKNFLAATVLQEDNSEFIREIRPNYFHCGFCNVTFPFMEAIVKHTTSLGHRMFKIECIRGRYRALKINTKHEDVYMKVLLHGFEFDPTEA